MNDDRAICEYAVQVFGWHVTAFSGALSLDMVLAMCTTSRQNCVNTERDRIHDKVVSTLHRQCYP
jgi:hypothetical protein